jgi:hypothetical protein
VSPRTFQAGALRRKRRPEGRRYKGGGIAAKQGPGLAAIRSCLHQKKRAGETPACGRQGLQESLEIARDRVVPLLFADQRAVFSQAALEVIVKIFLVAL